MSAKLTKTRLRVLREICAADSDGARPYGADLTAAYWLRAKGLASAGHVHEFLQIRYFPTPAGRAALAEQGGSE